ncbi:hypothetical protein K4L04_01435 [Phaeobacter inhibens]|uniref:hypothetical protein n=1 Tax=Phaeobacter inhibens TaxID=221822 RepID=UPI0021A75477|nr:hypothetical protein [Phaeobacter inhibens]UWR76651.1 hypothetical protein K4L04_01435 [Phaeobacter inhibens]
MNFDQAGADGKNPPDRLPFVTVLRAEGFQLRKRFAPSRTDVPKEMRQGWREIDVEFPTFFDAERCEFQGPQELADLLDRIRLDPERCAMLGETSGTTGIRRKYDDGVLRNTTSRVVWFDMDGFEGTLQEAICAIREALRVNVTLVAKPSASSGLKPGLRYHFAAVLKAEASEAQRKAVLARIDNCDVGSAQCSKIIYTADPLYLDGLPAPSRDRAAKVYTGEVDMVPELPAVYQKQSAPLGIPSPRDTTSNWGRAQLESAVDILNNVEKGDRNNTINRQAYRIGRLVGAGWIEPLEAQQALLEAAEATEEEGYYASVRSGMQAGYKRPLTHTRADEKEQTPLMPPYVPKRDELEPEEAQVRLRTILCRFMEDARRMAVKGTQGLGKTDATLGMMAERDEVCFLMLLPDTEKAAEALADYPGEDAMQIRGRSAAGPNGEPMCLSLGRIELALAVGSENLNRDVCAFCPSKNQCQYKVQERYFLTKPPRVVFAPHDYAHIPVPGGWIPDAVILDENLRTGGIDMGTTTPANTILGYQIQPEKLLEAHRLTTPDTPMGPKEILAWRLRKEVLEAICEGQRFITHGGMVTVPKVRPFIWNEQALLVLDGTLRPELAAMFTGGDFDEVHEIRAKRNVRTTQIVGNYFGAINLYRGGQLSEPIPGLLTEFEGAVFTYKKVRKDLGRMQDPAWGHHGAVRGKNQWAEYRRGLFLGQNQPPIEVLEVMAQALGDEYGFEVVGIGGALKELRGIRMADGSAEPTEVWTHPDETVRDLLESAREDETMQEVDRLRLVWHKGCPKEVILASPLALDICVDKIVQWKDYRQGRETDRCTHAILTGLLPGSPQQAVKLRPDIWNSTSTAERDYKALPKDWKTYCVEVQLCTWTEGQSKGRAIKAYYAP